MGAVLYNEKFSTQLCPECQLDSRIRGPSRTERWSRIVVVTVRRERRWTSAVASPAAITAGAPVLRLVSYTYMPSPLPRQVQWSMFARRSPLSAAFPVEKSGRLLQLFFRGLLSVHSCYGLHARGVAKRPFTSKAPTASLPPLPFRLLPGGANQFPGGTTPAVDHRLFTAHPVSRLPGTYASMGTM